MRSITYLAHNGGCGALHALWHQQKKVFPFTQNLTMHSAIRNGATDARKLEISGALAQTKVLVVSLSAEECDCSQELEVHALTEAARNKIPCVIIVSSESHVGLVRSMPSDVRAFIHLAITPTESLREKLCELLPTAPFATVYVAEGLRSERFGAAVFAIENLMA